jgi:protein-L-isoaspartate(D-aspartate) O-methyltransferase
VTRGLAAGFLPHILDACAEEPTVVKQETRADAAPTPELAIERERMVATQIETRGAFDARVLAALRRVPRHRFVAEELAGDAYADCPLPIGSGQTISQPFMVAVMTDLLRLRPGDRVLEIGTGCGYQSAVLAELGARVFSIEVVPELAERARRTLAEMGYGQVTVVQGDGWQGLPAEAPFDRIIVTAAPDRVPEALVEQLAVGGRMVVPVGGADQQLRLIEKTEQGVREEELFAVRFVPMIEG